MLVLSHQGLPLPIKFFHMLQQWPSGTKFPSIDPTNLTPYLCSHIPLMNPCIALPTNWQAPSFFLLLLLSTLSTVHTDNLSHCKIQPQGEDTFFYSSQLSKCLCPSLCSLTGQQWSLTQVVILLQHLPLLATLLVLQVMQSPCEQMQHIFKC